MQPTSSRYCNAPSWTVVNPNPWPWPQKINEVCGNCATCKNYTQSVLQLGTNYASQGELLQLTQQLNAYKAAKLELSKPSQYNCDNKEYSNVAKNAVNAVLLASHAQGLGGDRTSYL